MAWCLCGIMQLSECILASYKFKWNIDKENCIFPNETGYQNIFYNT